MARKALDESAAVEDLLQRWSGPKFLGTDVSESAHPVRWVSREIRDRSDL